MTTTASAKPKKPKAKAKSKAPAKGKTLRCGAMSAYTPEITIEICMRIAQCESLRMIAKRPGMPALRTLTQWQSQHPDFAAMLDKARQARADARVELINDLCNKVVAGTLDPHAGRTAIDGHKWLAARENWTKWGDKAAIAVATVPSPHEEAARKGDAAAMDAFMARVQKLADAQGFVRRQTAKAVEAEIIPPPEPFHSPREHIADRMASQPRPPTIENDASGEPTKHRERPRPPEEKREFQQLRCSAERPEILDRDRYAQPYVVGNSCFGRLRRGG